MSKTYRVILIDPEARSISELESAVTLNDVHELVGAETCDHFRIAEHPYSDDYGWVSDSGLKDQMPVYAFLLPTGKDPIAGKCLIIGADREGGFTCDARMPLALLRADVTWLGLILPEVTWDHTAQGSRAIVTYSRVRT